MAIIKSEDEFLVSMRGNKNVDMDQLIQESHRIRDTFKHVNINGAAAKPLFMDRDRRLVQARKGAASIHTDVSEYAFGQACNMIGVPASYMKKLYDIDMDELADTNIRTMLKKREADGKIMDGSISLVSEGVTEAIVSDRYSFGFQSPEVLETISKNLPGNFSPNQAYLSKGKLHLRLIDFDNPVYVGPNRDKMTVGFTVSTSDIGKSALKVNFFIYRFACMNGLVHVAKGGTLYRQSHIGEPFTVENINEFVACFQDIQTLKDDAIDLIASSQNRMMSEDEMRRILDTCKKSNVNIGEAEKEKIIDIAKYQYSPTKWGLINGVTEVAQNHTLDTRIDYESWAGRLLYSKVA